MTLVNVSSQPRGWLAVLRSGLPSSFTLWAVTASCLGAAFYAGTAFALFSLWSAAE